MLRDYSGDVNNNAILVPATGLAHGVRRLRTTATWARATRWSRQLPVARTAAAGLRFWGFLLRNGHL